MILKIYKKNINNRLKKFATFINIVEITKFSFIGIFSTFFNFFVFLSLTFLFSYKLIIASIIGYISGFLISFCFGRDWIFGKRYKLKFTSLAKFVSVYLIGGLILVGLIKFFIIKFQFGNLLSWVFASFITALFNFILLKYWVFGDRKKIASQRWGGLSKLEFLQSAASNLVAYINPAVTHNLEKYYAIKKVFYLSSIEDIVGDYLEFGVFEGSSFAHAIRCYLNTKEYMPPKNDNKINFFGFDSFDGFGKLSDDDFHPFYEDEQFKTNLSLVKSRIKNCAKDTNFKLIKGFFEETLSINPKHYGIKNARIIFIDADTYSGSFLALEFCKELIIKGTYFILDDFYSYKGSKSKGVAGAFEEFRKKYKIQFREVFSYGMGGKVFVCADI